MQRQKEAEEEKARPDWRSGRQKTLAEKFMNSIVTEPKEAVVSSESDDLQEEEVAT